MIVSVCLSLCPRAYRRNYTSNLRQIFFVYYQSPWFGPSLACDTLCTSGFMDDAHSGQEKAIRKGSILKVAQQGAAGI